MLPVLAVATLALLIDAAPSPAPSPARTGAPASNPFPPGAHAALKCGRIVIGIFASVAEGSPAGDALPPSTPAPLPSGFVPPILAGKAGTLILRDGTFDLASSPWRLQTGTVPAQRQECELDLDDGSGDFRIRYVVTGAAPLSIEPDPARGPTGVSRVILHHDGVALLLF
jgi:hypothetical protein